MEPPMYQVRQIELRAADLQKVLLPRPRDRVFHVTTQEAWPSIVASGFVLVDPPEDVVKWEYDAYFRSVRHISLCDLRALAEDDLELGLERFPFLDPRRSSAHRIALTAKAVGLVGRFSGHSPQVGMGPATWWPPGKRGSPPSKSPDAGLQPRCPAHYTRGELAWKGAVARFHREDYGGRLNGSRMARIPATAVAYESQKARSERSPHRAVVARGVSPQGTSASGSEGALYEPSVLYLS